MNFLTAVSTGLTLFGMLGGGSKSGATDSEHGHGYDGSGSSGSGFLGILKTGARHLVDSQKEPYIGAADTSMFASEKPRSVEDLTRGRPATGGLSPAVERLYQNAAVRQAFDHYRQNGSRDVNMQSMLNEAGIVSPTSRQGKTTLATRSPDLKSEINIG